MFFFRSSHPTNKPSQKSLLTMLCISYPMLFLYLEDIDWCRTARRRGIATWYAPDARVWHGVSRSVGSIDPRILPDMSAKVSFLTQEVTAEQQRPLLAVNPDALVARDRG